MREDMSKVVIERPRWGHSLPGYKTRLRIRRYDPEKDYDDLPRRISGSRSKYIRGGEIKFFSDLLGPLRRFLRSNIGRPWDQVYSEMKEFLDDRKVTGRHIFEHVDSEVETHAFIDPDGKAYTWGNSGREPVYGLYVDLRSGLLRWSDTKPWWRNRGKSKGVAQKANRVRLSANACHVKMNGIWYFVEYRMFEKPVGCDQENEASPSISIPEISEKPILLFRKKQLNHKELKSARLKNDPPPSRDGAK
jgi:hypothetical protein